MQANSLQQQKGSMLLEALMVIVLLSIGLTFIVQSLSSSMRALSYSNNYSKAAFLTEQKLSEILLNKNISVDIQDNGYFDSPFKEFHYKITSGSITWPQQSAPSEAVGKINLDISWPSGPKIQNVATALCLLNPSEDKK